MSLFDVCRLCSSKNNLVWVFNMENETDENMEKVIFVTTGIEIHKKDMVSQKICDKCTQFTIAMSSFRKKCLENDKRLKDTCMQLLKDNDMKIPNTEVTIKHDKGTVKDKPKQVQSKCLPKVHATVADLFKTYPGLKLPTPCLNKDVAPFVSMPLDQVEQYFENRRLNFNEHVRYCFRSKKADDKESANFSSEARPAKPNFVINAAIISNEEDEDNGVVRPIKIKIFSKDKFYNNSDKNHNISLNKYSANKVCDKPPATNRPKVPEHTRFYRKRHFPPVKDSLDTENDKQTPAPLSFIEKSFPLHICDICNSVHYNAKDLKKHQFKHLQCQFCKMKFINSESKLEHLENKCIIKSTMENLPSIEIEKIEYNLKIRKQYPEAFTDFPALERETNVTNNCNAKNLESVKVATSISPLKKDRYKHVTAEDTVEIIDISSDDDDDDDVVPIMESNSTNTDASSTVLGHSTNQKSKDESQSVAGVVSKNVPADSNTIIKPNIKVRDSSVLKGVGPNMSDKDVLRKLLISVPLKSYAEISTQTYSPKNHAIRLNSHELSAELNNLKAMLHSYIIPVVIKRGNFSVSYDYSKNSRGPKRLHLWNDLQPADVKVKKRRLSTHLSPVETTSEKSKTNSVHSIPISEPSGMENNVSTSLQRAQHRSSSVGDAATFHQAVTTSSSPLPTNQCPSTAELQTEINVPSPSASTSSKSNISALQQVYSSHSKSQSTTRIPNSSSSGIVILQHIYQSSSSAQPQEIVAAPIPASRCTSSSETNISASQQALVTSTPVSSYANSCVSNTSVPQQPDNYQYSSSSKLPAIDVMPSPAPSCTNSSASNMIIPVQTVSQRPSIPQLQEVASTCTNSSVTDVFATQTNASQYFSASEPQATPASASTYKNSSVSNITAPQQAACHYSSIPPSQNSAAPIIASTCTGSLTHISASEQDFPILSCSKSLSNITVSQQAACQFSSTSNTQTIISVPSSALSSTSNAVIPQQTVCQYSSIPSSQVITAPISSSTCTSSFVTDISVSQNDVYQYSSNSVDVATPNPVSSYNNSYGSNITAPLPSDYQYPLTSEPQAVISKSSSALLCTNWAVTNTIVQQQTVIDLSTSHHYSSDFHTREVFTMPGPTLSGTSVSEANMSVSRPFGYQYSSASNSKEIKSASVLSSSMCTSTSAENLFGSQQDSPISKPQRVTADDVPASTCVSTSSSNISAPLQDVYQCTSTSKPQEGSAPPTPPIASPTTPLALNISAPQSFIRIKDMSELT